jgi:hypothetical protein
MATARREGAAQVTAHVAGTQTSTIVRVLPPVRVASPAGWAAVYSREPNSSVYRRTGCARFEGAPGCPMP